MSTINREPGTFSGIASENADDFILMLRVRIEGGMGRFSLTGLTIPPVVCYKTSPVMFYPPLVVSGKVSSPLVRNKL